MHQAKLAVLRPFDSLVEKSTELLLSSKARYKFYFYARIRQLVTPATSQQVFIDLAPHQTNLKTRQDNASAPYGRQSRLPPKLLSNSVGPFSSYPLRHLPSLFTLTAYMTRSRSIVSRSNLAERQSCQYLGRR